MYCYYNCIRMFNSIRPLGLVLYVAVYGYFVFDLVTY